MCKLVLVLLDGKEILSAYIKRLISRASDHLTLFGLPPSIPEARHVCEVTRTHIFLEIPIPFEFSIPHLYVKGYGLFS